MARDAEYYKIQLNVTLLQQKNKVANCASKVITTFSLLADARVLPRRHFHLVSVIRTSYIHYRFKKPIKLV